MVIRSQKIKIYPNSNNQDIFIRYFGYKRYLWNKVLAERNKQYKIYKTLRDLETLPKKDLNKYYFPNVNNLRRLEKLEWENYFISRTREIIFEEICQAWDNCFNPNMPKHKQPKFKKKKDPIQSVTFRE